MKVLYHCLYCSLCMRSRSCAYKFAHKKMQMPCIYLHIVYQYVWYDICFRYIYIYCGARCQEQEGRPRPRPKKTKARRSLRVRRLRVHIIIGFLLGFFLQVVAQLGTNIRYSGAIRTSSTSPPFPLTSLCPWDYPPVTSSAFIVVLQWSGSWGGSWRPRW